MNCLKDWIGIYGCDAPEVFSNVYINQLPGVSLESFEGISNAEQQTYLDVWNDIQERACKKFFNRLQTELAKRYKLKSLKSTIDLGNIVTPSNTTAPTDQYRGFTYELKLKYQFRRSDFQALNVQKLKLYLINAGSVDLKIIDLDTAEVLWSKTITGTVGWNVIQVNERFNAQRLFFGYDDNNTITAPEFAINNTNSDWFNTSFGYFYGYNNANAILRGAVTLDKSQIGTQTEVTFAPGSNTYGLSAVFSLVCVFDFLICNNKELFTTALWYLLGAELDLEIQYSDRLNRLTTTDAEKAVKHEAYCMSEFNNELNIILDGIDISTIDACIECNTQVMQMDTIL